MCTGFCERGEGGKGGGELGSDKKVEPTGWKVISLAESHVGCREQGAPRFPPASLNACVVLVLITGEALVILGHTSLQKPTCAWWSRLTFAHIYILQTHAQSGGLHMRRVNPRCPRLRSLSEHCQNRWSEQAAHLCHWLRETARQKKMIGLRIRKEGGGENVARAKSVKVQNLEFSSLGNKMKRLLNHFIFLPHAFSLFCFHGHAHTDTHTYI